MSHKAKSCALTAVIFFASISVANAQQQNQTVPQIELQPMQMGTSFDCSKLRQDVPSLVCNDPELRMADLKQMQSYYALRNTNPERHQEFRAQFLGRIQALVKECSTPEMSGPKQKQCALRGLTEMRNIWLRDIDITKNNAAIEEARLDLKQLIGAQLKLKELLLIPEESKLDGVYGNKTREALAQFQNANGLTPNGFATTQTVDALLKAKKTDSIQVSTSGTTHNTASGTTTNNQQTPQNITKDQFPVGVGKTFRDCPNCPEMVVLPSGSFTMGSPFGEPSRRLDEEPQKEMKVSVPLAVGKYEVTFSEWDACVANGGCTERPSDEGWGRGRQPVINVSWIDADQYTKWLSRYTGRTYRLLTEAEWEYAARAGTSSSFSFGPNIQPDQANYRQSGKGRATPVGTFPPNAWGLHDMHGNVWEWVEDCPNESYGQGISDSTVAIRGLWCSGYRMLRGGAFHNQQDFLRSARRESAETTKKTSVIGFRVAAESGGAAEKTRREEAMVKAAVDTVSAQQEQRRVAEEKEKKRKEMQEKSYSECEKEVRLSYNDGETKNQFGQIETSSRVNISFVSFDSTGALASSRNAGNNPAHSMAISIVRDRFRNGAIAGRDMITMNGVCVIDATSGRVLGVDYFNTSIK